MPTDAERWTFVESQVWGWELQERRADDPRAPTWFGRCYFWPLNEKPDSFREMVDAGIKARKLVPTKE